METIGEFYSWVKRLGQWHLWHPSEEQTLCNMPILGNNYSNWVKPEDRTKCKKCWEKFSARKV